jgi:hypothetical protein
MPYSKKGASKINRTVSIKNRERLILLQTLAKKIDQCSGKIEVLNYLTTRKQ